MARGSQTLSRFRNYASFAVDTFLLGRQRPYLFILVINDQCNLDCFYCTTKNTGLYDLDFPSVGSALAEAYARGHRALVITGGEPLLWRSEGRVLGNVVSYARHLGFTDIAVFTNGTFPLDLESVTFVVTVDGTKETHNRIRSNSYDLVVRNVRACQSKVQASVPVTKANFADLEVAVEEIAALNVFRGITFNLFTHTPDLVARYGISGGDRLRVLDRIWNLKRRGYPVILSRAAYEGLRANDWRRPVQQIELFAGGNLFTCCRDVGRPDVCRNCGYTSCAEISLILACRPSAVFELLRAK